MFSTLTLKSNDNKNKKRRLPEVARKTVRADKFHGRFRFFKAQGQKNYYYVEEVIINNFCAHKNLPMTIWNTSRYLLRNVLFEEVRNHINKNGDIEDFISDSFLDFLTAINKIPLPQYCGNYKTLSDMLKTVLTKDKLFPREKMLLETTLNYAQNILLQFDRQSNAALLEHNRKIFKS